MNRRVLGLVGSVALAAMGTFLVLSYVRGADDRAAAGEDRVEVLVVSDDVAAGERASDIGDRVASVLVPAKVQADNAVASLDQIDDELVTAVDLVPGEQILSSRFVTEEVLAEEVGLEVPEDLLQVTISLTPERAVGGQLLPGDLVAVVASFDPFQYGAVEPGEEEGEFLGSTGGEEGSGDSPTTGLQTPNSSHIILHKVLVTGIQLERLPAESDQTDAAEVGVELAPTGNLLITLAVDAPDVEKVVFTAEHGALWLADEPETASEEGTTVQTRRLIYL